MSATIFRTGLWILVAIAATYVLKETASDSVIAEAVDDDLLVLLVQAALGVLVVGVIARLIEKAGFRSKNRCGVCRARISGQALYCRDHLQEVLEEEDLRHRTRNTRLPD